MGFLRRLFVSFLLSPVVGFPVGATFGAVVGLPKWFEGATTGAMMGLYVGPITGFCVGLVPWLLRKWVRCVVVGAVIGLGAGAALWSEDFPARWSVVCGGVGGLVGVMAAILNRDVNPEKENV